MLILAVPEAVAPRLLATPRSHYPTAGWNTPQLLGRIFFDPLEGPWGLKLVQDVLVRYPFEETVRQKRWVQTSLSSSKSDRL